MTTGFIVNHLWQSTCFGVLAAALAWVLRKYSPKVRFWMWCSASLKFLVPFALLVNLGSVAPRPAPLGVPVSASNLTVSVVQMAVPYGSPAISPVISKVRTRIPRHWPPMIAGLLWAFGLGAVVSARFRSWLGIRAAVRQGTPVELPVPVPALVTPGMLEPGIVGFLRPVLVLPAKFLEALSSGQVEAVLAHEMCHVRRRDNLFAAIHMAVEAIFWFHPLVWWVGSRMIDERERACDEEVLRLGCEPAEYVEGILKVCRMYTETPLACVAGVTGADVKKRLRAILAGTLGRELTVAKKLVLATLGTAVLCAPVTIGMLTAPLIQAQNAPANTPKFEVASIRACSEPLNISGSGVHSSPGRLATDCNQLLNLIGNAYNAFADGTANRTAEDAPIKGGPAWLASASYDIQATAEGTPSVPMMLGPMMQKLLENRFHLKIHRQTVEGPVYFLTAAHGASKLQPNAEKSCTPWDVPPPPVKQGKKYCGTMISALSPGVESLGTTMDEFAKTLRLVVGRPVINKTGISGRFDMRVKFSREGTELAGMVPRGPDRAPDPDGPPSVFVALQEQLGLKLEAGKGPVDTLVVDRIERPSAN
ncbi:MAG TPA: M56 family metallopeptidase [Bryobacteraceae bacterium]|jgi:uncharacterized protein (TIGR03435 family)